MLTELITWPFERVCVYVVQWGGGQVNIATSHGRSEAAYLGDGSRPNNYDRNFFNVLSRTQSRRMLSEWVSVSVRLWVCVCVWEKVFWFAAVAINYNLYLFSITTPAAGQEAWYAREVQDDSRETSRSWNCCLREMSAWNVEREKINLKCSNIFFRSPPQTTNHQPPQSQHKMTLE